MTVDSCPIRPRAVARRAPALVAVFMAAQLVLAGSARADVTTSWNNTVNVIGGPQNQRTWAMVHLAMFDAVNAIEGGYTPYQRHLPAPPAGASAEAAAAGAAHGVLIRLFPARAADLAAALTASLSTIPDGPGESNGVAYGDAVAALLYTARLDDNMLAAGPAYTSTNAPGDYQLTPGAPPQPVNTGAASWRPFGLRSVDQFRPAPPPSLHSGRYARDLDETRRMGVLLGSERTPEQDLIGRWHTEQAQFQFNRIARAALDADGGSILDHARILALLNMALNDATAAVFEAKYVYRFWRPTTAIRRAGEDGNRHTEPDPAWTPFLTTPPHPEYPAAHGAVQGAAARVMTALLGRHFAFLATSPTVPGEVRSFDSFADFAADGAEARIYGGMHFRNSLEVGSQLGTKVGRWILRHYLRPIH